MASKINPGRTAENKTLDQGGNPTIKKSIYKPSPDVITESTTVADHNNGLNAGQSCVVYKFQSRPPYEGFILILVIVVIAIILIWWLNTKLKAPESINQ